MEVEACDVPDFARACSQVTCHIGQAAPSLGVGGLWQDALLGVMVEAGAGPQGLVRPEAPRQNGAEPREVS